MQTNMNKKREITCTCFSLSKYPIKAENEPALQKTKMHNISMLFEEKNLNYLDHLSTVLSSKNYKIKENKVRTRDNQRKTEE